MGRNTSRCSNSVLISRVVLVRQSFYNKQRTSAGFCTQTTERKTSILKITTQQARQAPKRSPNRTQTKTLVPTNLKSRQRRSRKVTSTFPWTDRLRLKNVCNLVTNFQFVQSPIIIKAIKMKVLLNLRSCLKTPS